MGISKKCRKKVNIFCILRYILCRNIENKLNTFVNPLQKKSTKRKWFKSKIYSNTKFCCFCVFEQFQIAKQRISKKKHIPVYLLSLDLFVKFLKVTHLNKVFVTSQLFRLQCKIEFVALYNINKAGKNALRLLK